MVDTGSRSQNPLYVPLRDTLTMPSPMSLPQISGKTSETGGKEKQDAQTFEDDGILWAPNVAKRLRNLVSHNMNRFRFISENIEVVSTPKILGRVDFNAILICLRRGREFFIKMGILLESQTILLIPETAKVPQKLLKTWTVTEHLWHRNQILGGTSISWHPRFTTIGWMSERELRRWNLTTLVGLGHSFPTGYDSSLSALRASVRGEKPSGNVTFDCKFSFKACRIFK